MAWRRRRKGKGGAAKVPRGGGDRHRPPEARHADHRRERRFPDRTRSRAVAQDELQLGGAVGGAADAAKRPGGGPRESVARQRAFGGELREDNGNAAADRGGAIEPGCRAQIEPFFAVQWTPGGDVSAVTM